MKPEIKNPLRTEWQRRWFALDVTHPRVQTLADAAMQFCMNWITWKPAPGLLYICGDTGTGKSHLARAVAAYCRGGIHLAVKNMPAPVMKMPSMGTYHWPELANEFRDKNVSALRDLFESDFVLLDDVGAEDDPFKVVADKLCQVLSHREDKFTVITSNVLTHEFASVDPRIADRLLRNSRIVDLKGVPSYAEHTRMRGREVQPA